jgi:hypothetical protein
MRLHLLRFSLGETATLGALSVDGRFFCFVLEDRYRPPPEEKVRGQTAIPVGDYNVEVTHSPRFGVPMPLVKNVPGFEGIRIHSGNTVDQTDGCLLVGMQATAETVFQSKAAYEALMKRLEAVGGKATLRISLADV